MPTFTRYCLEARGPFRVGRPGIGQESITTYIHSDTIFGALCSAIVDLHGLDMLDKWLKLFSDAKTPPFVLSSAFPYYRKLFSDPAKTPPFIFPTASPYYKKIFFYPRPQLPNFGKNDDKDDKDSLKDYKDKKFVSEGVYRQLLNGDDLKKDATVTIHEQSHDSISQEHVALLTIDESKGLPPQLWQQVQHPHVTVDRVTSASALYYAGRIFFAEGGGYHFLVDWRDRTVKVGDTGPTAEGLFNEALYYLSDTGLGSDRASGHGQFVYPEKPETVMFADPEPDDKESYAQSSLSLYYPKMDEWEKLDKSSSGVTAYSLTKRVGWITARGMSTLQRKPVRMLSEGACLDFETNFDTTSLGTLAEVTPDKDKVPPEVVSENWSKIYRYGQVLTLPIRKTKRKESD